MTTVDSERTLFSAESYFKTQPPPPTLEQDIADVRSFVHRQQDLGNKVVLVTVSVCPRLPPRQLRRLIHLRAVGQLSPWSSMCEQYLCIPTLCLELKPPSFPPLTTR
jgi:hypothetical protein